MAGERGTLRGSFRFAARGVLEAAASQRNMRIHLAAAVLVAAFGGAAPLGLAEQLALLLCVFLVLSAEVMNSALEAAMDLAGAGVDERVRRAKDAAAGAVLLLALGAVAVLAAVLVADWDQLRPALGEIARALLLGLPLAGLSAFLAFPFRRPGWLDAAAAACGVALLFPLALSSRSVVFTALGAAAFAVCAAAAFVRRAG